MDVRKEEKDHNSNNNIKYDVKVVDNPNLNNKNVNLLNQINLDDLTNLLDEPIINKKVENKEKPKVQLSIVSGVIKYDVIKGKIKDVSSKQFDTKILQSDNQANLSYNNSNKNQQIKGKNNFEISNQSSNNNFAIESLNSKSNINEKSGFSISIDRNSSTVDKSTKIDQSNKNKNIVENKIEINVDSNKKSELKAKDYINPNFNSVKSNDNVNRGNINENTESNILVSNPNNSNNVKVMMNNNDFNQPVDDDNLYPIQVKQVIDKPEKIEKYDQNADKAEKVEKNESKIKVSNTKENISNNSDFNKKNEISKDMIDKQSDNQYNNLNQLNDKVNRENFSKTDINITNSIINNNVNSQYTSNNLESSIHEKEIKNKVFKEAELISKDDVKKIEIESKLKDKGPDNFHNTDQKVIILNNLQSKKHIKEKEPLNDSFKDDKIVFSKIEFNKKENENNFEKKSKMLDLDGVLDQKINSNNNKVNNKFTGKENNFISDKDKESKEDNNKIDFSLNSLKNKNSNQNINFNSNNRIDLNNINRVKDQGNNKVELNNSQLSDLESIMNYTSNQVRDTRLALQKAKEEKRALKEEEAKSLLKPEDQKRLDLRGNLRDKLIIK